MHIFSAALWSFSMNFPWAYAFDVDYNTEDVERKNISGKVTTVSLLQYFHLPVCYVKLMYHRFVKRRAM